MSPDEAVLAAVVLAVLFGDSLAEMLGYFFLGYFFLLCLLLGLV